MACNDCFNGCVQTTSDQCVKYTGNNIAALDIEKGDPLSDVIAKINAYLITIVDGSVIIPTIDGDDICTALDDLIPAGDITLNVLLTAIIQLLCDVKDDVDTFNDATFSNTSCLTDVAPPYPTALLEVVQAIVNKICATNGEISDLQDDVSALQNALPSYVLISDVNTYIATYLSGLDLMNKYYMRMVPMVAERYYGPLYTNFSLDGSGLGAYEKIYLCNGLHSTPNLEGEFTADMKYIMYVPNVIPE